jgi:hypothetical protein
MTRCLEMDSRVRGNDKKEATHLRISLRVLGENRGHDAASCPRFSWLRPWRAVFFVTRFSASGSKSFRSLRLVVRSSDPLIFLTCDTRPATRGFRQNPHVRNAGLGYIAGIARGEFPKIAAQRKERWIGIYCRHQPYSPAL